MDRDVVRELGFDLGERATGGRSGGAWFATAPDGEPVVLKWFPDETMAGRYTSLLPALDALRARGVPVPSYSSVHTGDGWTLSAQQRLPGSSLDNPSPAMVHQVLECIDAATGIRLDDIAWGDSIVQTLRAGADGWGSHEDLLERILAIGHVSDPAWFPNMGLMHFDLHTDNVLVGDDGMLTGIIDWEDARCGDPRFDLTRFAFDLDGHDQPVWSLVEATGIERRVLRAYVAHHILTCTTSALLHHPHDVPRQLARAERVLDRYG